MNCDDLILKLFWFIKSDEAKTRVIKDLGPFVIEDKDCGHASGARLSYEISDIGLAPYREIKPFNVEDDPWDDLYLAYSQHRHEIWPWPNHTREVFESHLAGRNYELEHPEPEPGDDKLAHRAKCIGVSVERYRKAILIEKAGLSREVIAGKLTLDQALERIGNIWIALLQRPEGASVQDFVKVTGWKPASVRAELSTNRLGALHNITPFWAADGSRRFRIEAS